MGNREDEDLLLGLGELSVVDERADGLEVALERCLKRRDDEAREIGELVALNPLGNRALRGS